MAGQARCFCGSEEKSNGYIELLVSFVQELFVLLIFCDHKAVGSARKADILRKNLPPASPLIRTLWGGVGHLTQPQRLSSYKSPTNNIKNWQLNSNR